MKDRIAKYPGRVRLVPVPGQENIYDLVRADEPTGDETPLNKATLLKDQTAESLGLTGDAVPDDALNRLKSLADKAQTAANAAQTRANNTFTKAQTLTAATAALYGLGSSAAPNDVLARNAANLAGTTAVWTLIQAYKTAGAYTFTVPAGVTRIGVYMVGGGGSGGAAASGSYITSASGGGSGFGKNIVLEVAGGQKINVVVGAGGEGVSVEAGKSSTGKNGGTTSVGGMTAPGGGGGRSKISVNPSIDGADGGQVSSGFGTQDTFCPSPVRYGNSPVWVDNGSKGTDKFTLSSQTARDGQNAFDPAMVTLCAGAGSCHESDRETNETILPLPDGTSGGTAEHPNATGNGNGGFGASMYGAGGIQSGAGSDGMVLIYKAGI